MNAAPVCWIEVFFLLTFIIGHVPQRRVAGVSLVLTFIEAPFNPALCKNKRRNNLCFYFTRNETGWSNSELTNSELVFVFLLSVNLFLKLFSAPSCRLYLHKQHPYRTFKMSLMWRRGTTTIDCMGSGAAVGLFEMFFSKTAGIQHCYPTATATPPLCIRAHTQAWKKKKEPVHITEAVCWNRGHCPVLIST